MVFLATTFLLLPLALLGLRTYAAVDMLEPTAPYRSALTRPPHVVSPIQTDQVEGFPGPISFYRDLRRGVFQLWNPDVAAGAPTGTLPFNGLLSPFSAGYLVLPAWYAVSLKVALALLFCQSFTYLLMRRLGAAVGPSTLAAVAYTFAGTNLVFVHRVGAVFVLPALLWATHRLVAAPSWRRTAGLALMVAWAWFEGFPAGFVYCVYATAAWGAWLALHRREAILRRLAAVAGGLAWGVAASCITLLPFVSELLARGTLTARSFDRHLPGAQVFGLLDLSVTRPLFYGGENWSGPNSVESVSHVGWIVAAAAVAGLVAAGLGRLRTNRDGAAAWTFFGGMAGLGLVLVYVGGPLLDVAYRLPGITDNPIARARFLINMGAAVLAGLTLDAWWRRDPEQTSATDPPLLAPRGVSMVVLAVTVLAFGLFADDLWRAARSAGQVEDVAVSMAVGVGLAAVVAVVALAGRQRRRSGPPTVVVAALAALLFVQLALPLRHFTPEAPVDDFYTEQEGHLVVKRLVGDRYRFLASAFEFYPTSGQVHGIPDLRGVALHSRQFKDLVAPVSPVAFERDPLKLIVTRDEMNLASTALDDLAVRYVALATTEEPFGRVVDADDGWDGMRSAAVPIEGTAPGPVGGVALPLRVSGPCEGAAVEVSLDSDGTELGRSARPAFDVDGWTSFALTGQTLDAGDPYRLVVSSTLPGCQVEVGMAGDRVARRLIVLDRDGPVRLVTTEGAWIYERPSAWELVSAHSRWRAFADQPELLAWLATRSPAEADVAAFVGTAPPQSSPPGTSTVVDYSVEGGRVRAETRGDAALLVVSMNRSAGWSATVDGRSAPLVAVDGALMGVFVPAGDHVVRLAYLPRSFTVGLVVTGVALAGAIGALAAPAWLSRRRSAGRRGPRPTTGPAPQG